MVRSFSRWLLAFDLASILAHPPPPSTNSARAKRTVEPRMRSRLGGGSADAEGHNLNMQAQPGSSAAIELDETPSWDTFYREYVQKNKPCVFRGHARSQPGYEKWADDEYLTRLMGDVDVTAEVWKSEDRDGPRQQLKFRKFIKEIYKKDRNQELYAVIGLEDLPQARADFFMPEPVRCKEILPQSLTLWMSSGGTTSVLHTDDGENFLMLLDGTKEVMLVHQDNAQHMYAHAAKHRGTSAVHQDSVDHVMFPNFKHVKWLKAVLNKGDTLYIPHSYWHQVNSRGRNLGVNFWWGHQKDFSWWDPSNRSEFDATMYGSEGFISFDDLKKRGFAAAKMKCTPLDDASFEHVNFVEEGDYKNGLSKKHAALKRKRGKQQKTDL